MGCNVSVLEYQKKGHSINYKQYKFYDTYCKIRQPVLPIFCFFLIINGYDGGSTIVDNENYCQIFVLFIYARCLLEMVWNTVGIFKVFNKILTLNENSLQHLNCLYWIVIGHKDFSEVFSCSLGWNFLEAHKNYWKRTVNTKGEISKCLLPSLHGLLNRWTSHWAV